MNLSGDDLDRANAVFEKLSKDLPKTKKGGRRFWEIVGQMQELANHGLPKAKKYMAQVDVSRAPSDFGQSTSFQQILVGPRGTSFRGSRRQLQADPNSPNKTFGMRPHGRRDEPLDD